MKSTFLEQVKGYQWQSHGKGLPRQAPGVALQHDPMSPQIGYYTSFIGGPLAPHSGEEFQSKFLNTNLISSSVR